MNFADRLKKARTEKGLSKGELSKQIGVHYAQIGRYEEKGARPSAEVLGKLANALGVTTDYLINGSSEDLANNTLTDKELLNQFKKIDQFSNEDKNVVKVFLDAFITKRRVQELAG